MEALEEKFLDVVATEKKVDHARASKLIERCMNLVSTRLGVSYADVYNSIYNATYLGLCLKGKCSDFDLKKCQESCHCVVFEGKCYARYFEDAQKMNDDPDQYLQGMPTDKLAELVKLASYLYYNFDGGNLTDNTFDALEYTLNKRLKTKGRRYEKIGAPVLEKLRVKLPYPMASLDKVKPGSRLLLDFLASAPKFAWSLKLDGVSGMLVYKDGKIKGIYSRGDGTIGGDLLYLKDFVVLPTISDPKYKNIVVRVEFILNKRDWEEKYKGSYSNARSFVSAKINSGHVTQGMTDIKVVAYEIIDPGPGSKVPEPSAAFLILKNLGFEVVENDTLETPVVFEIMQLYKKLRESSIYNIDGLVLSIDKPRDVVTKLENPRHSVAFKMRLEDQIRKTKILNIEWNISRYGRMVPVAIYESVYIEGVRLHRASAYNAAHVRDWNLGKGSKIRVVRSGDTIPIIIDVEVDPTISPIYPPDKPSWHWKGSDIILDDIEGNKTVQLKRIEHFFVTIGVPRLREKTLEKMWDAGFRDIKAITNGTPDKFIKIKGIGKKSADGYYKNIHEIMRKTRIDRYIPASTTLELGIGRKLVKQLMRYYPNILDDDAETIKRMLTKKEIPGIGTKRIANIASNIPKFKAFLLLLNKNDVEYAITQDQKQKEKIRTRGYNTKIRGKTFVFTGFFGKIDYELEDYIYDNFGNFSTAVTSSTEAVVSANLLDVTNKMLSAQKLGVKVLSVEEFVGMYDIPYSKVKSEDPETIEIEIPLDPVDPDD